jgi:hypothetical protein
LSDVEERDPPTRPITEPLGPCPLPTTVQYTMDMRKLFVIAATAMAFFLAIPAGTGHAAPGHDRVSGTGALGQFGDPTVDLSAVDTSDGFKGGFTIVYPDGTAVGGTVSCLSVQGNLGYLTGTILRAAGPRQAANNWLRGNHVVIGLQDNGAPGAGDPDLLNFSPGFAQDPGCGPNPAATPTVEVVTGDYRIVDAA